MFFRGEPDPDWKETVEVFHNLHNREVYEYSYHDDEDVLRAQIYTIEGKREGVAKFFDEEGRRTRVEIYRLGKLQSFRDKFIPDQYPQETPSQRMSAFLTEGKEFAREMALYSWKTLRRLEIEFGEEDDQVDFKAKATQAMQPLLTEFYSFRELRDVFNKIEAGQTLLIEFDPETGRYRFWID